MNGAASRAVGAVGRPAGRGPAGSDDAGDPFSAAAGSVIHLLHGWARDMPIAVVVGPAHRPLYLYRDGRRETFEG